MTDVQTADLYDTDLYEWTLGQARAVRLLRDAAHGQGDVATALRALDWEHLIEELEGMAGKDRRELQGRLATIVEHLLKLDLCPTEAPRAGWRQTVWRSRFEIETMFQESPSLRRLVPAMLASPPVARLTRHIIDDLKEQGEVLATASIPLYTEDQVLGDWWPDQRGNDE